MEHSWRMETDLPPDLQAGLDRLTHGMSRRLLGRQAISISQAYRSGAASAHAIRSRDDALAYSLARLPATFAAAASVLDALKSVSPDYSPRTLIDIGAGPGTASWAAVGCFPDLTGVRLVDENDHFRHLALELLAFSAVRALREADYRKAGVRQLPATMEPADLVIASYFVGELPTDELISNTDVLWSRTLDILVVIEPGTPAGFARIRRLRSHLIAQGACVICPCPHDLECPLAGDDWCHFSRRLNRSRDQRQVKGASLSFEDEKFSYVALSRRKPALRATARVLAPPRVTKGVITSKLCTADGLVSDAVARRDWHAYKLRKNWRWGDAVSRSARADDG
jgi:ribosomal protein RSM22 (predicted rRNA methylase)